MTSYPSDRLVYWQHTSDLLLKVSIDKYFDDKPLLDQELNAIKTYIKHWIDLSYFEDKTDSDFLLAELESCKNIGVLNLLIHRLLDFGIDPF